MHSIQEAVRNSWKKIAISWPLQNFIASNPLHGLQHLSFEKALQQAAVLFEQQDIPQQMEILNQITMKWLQQFFDDKQAIFQMPNKQEGLYKAWYQLARFDVELHQNNADLIYWFTSLPDSVEEVIEQCLQRLDIKKNRYEDFITVLLTTLPGWAAYIHYCADWSGQKQYEYVQQEYIAMRLVITCMLWSDARELLNWSAKSVDVTDQMNTMISDEQTYKEKLLQDLKQNIHKAYSEVDAQFVFCIDPRSEPFRKQLEQIGTYQTFSCAGFFLIPTQIEKIDGQTYASCPVLLQPQHTVKQYVQCPDNDCSVYLRGSEILFLFQEFYRSLKYTFVTPFVLVEVLGPLVAIWTLLSTLVPTIAYKLYNFAVSMIRKPLPIRQILKDISVSAQCNYVETVLKSIGLIDNFARVVVIIGHGSTTRNNAYATSLDCGACGGRQGGNNAQIFAQMANDKEVRTSLQAKGIVIPETTIFVGAQHDTTTDSVELYDYDTDIDLKEIKENLYIVGINNAKFRMQYFDTKRSVIDRSVDWAQVRPEWGLARNGAMIIGPRSITKDLDLQGRVFLHSYDSKKDADGSLLTMILTAPLIVAQWINAQYLFSAMNNIAYGSGSKITLNVIGKFGVMQGNSSDLMHGLSLQSLYKTDEQAYHQVQRLLVIVYAPEEKVQSIIKEHSTLNMLVKNEWIKLVCMD